MTKQIAMITESSKETFQKSQEFSHGLDLLVDSISKEFNTTSLDDPVYAFSTRAQAHARGAKYCLQELVQEIEIIKEKGKNNGT